MRNSKLKPYINSCFNYTGNKFKQLPQLFDLFPNSTDTFVDLFCGGGVLGINAIEHMGAKHIIINDKLNPLISIFRLFQENDYQTIYDQIFAIINNYGLSNTNKYGYKYYGADSSEGLSKINRNGFLKLRDDFNNPNSKPQYSKALMLYVLIVFSFNNQIRFNKNNNFNLPVGKRDFNKSMQLKLAKFIELLHDKRITIKNKDFTEILIPNNSFVYCDPPYRIATATYNENNFWTSENDSQLFELLDDLNRRNIPFALSNVLAHKGLENEKLKEWSQHYHIHHINFGYNNSNYQSSSKKYVTREVLVTNY